MYTAEVYLLSVIIKRNLFIAVLEFCYTISPRVWLLADLWKLGDPAGAVFHSKVNFYKSFFFMFYFQVSEGLSFLHSSVKMVHGNVTPENVILNKSGAWKIMGFDFCVSSSNPSEQEVMAALDLFNVLTSRFLKSWKSMILSAMDQKMLCSMVKHETQWWCIVYLTIRRNLTVCVPESSSQVISSVAVLRKRPQRKLSNLVKQKFLF